ncbi:MAG: hypothetical protein IPN01_25275 [Deltaproteobacteria bacterium]|nr:hypothetical protein [Deltaproteobacteria bacterium]MBK9369568.1 hypothetical protein [Deltaproteobacteria bacterium]
MSKKIEEYRSLGPTRFRYLESVELHRVLDDDYDGTYSLSITLLAKPRASSERARFDFSGVTDFKIGDLNGPLCLLFEIRDESHRQLENLRFRVVESEEEAFKFWCRDFEFKILPSRTEG